MLSLGRSICFFAALSAVCVSSLHASIEKKPDAAKVLVKKLATSEESDTLLFPARVSSLVQTKIYAESEGVVRSLPLNVGAKITKKNVMMVIQHTDPVYRYAPVRVSSPVSGIVSSLDVTEGTQVTKGQLLASVIDPAKLRITLEIPAQDLHSLQAGMPGEFKSSGLRSPVTVKVLGVSPLVSPQTGTATADLQITSSLEKSGLLPGALGQVSLKTNIHQAITIPEDAVIYRDGKPLVRLLIDGKVKLSPVELGVKRRGSVEIMNGVKADDSLILRASRYVSEGETVQVEDEKAEKT